MPSAAMIEEPPSQPPVQSKLGKVFISYAHEDQEFALRIAEGLRQHDVPVWIDTGIGGGVEWSEELEENLETSNTLVLVFSPHAKKSKFVKKEVLTALDNDMHVIPVVYRSYSRWWLIIDLHFIYFRGLDDEVIAELLNVTPPKRSIWRRILTQLKLRAVQLLLIGLALAAALTWYLYDTSPPDTHFALANATPSSLNLRVENRGGRDSQILGGTFRMDFGTLPVEPAKLVLAAPAQAPGHSSGDFSLRVGGNGQFTPREREADGKYPCKSEFKPLLARSTVTVTFRVKERDKEIPKSLRIKGSDITPFLLEAYPDAVPRRKCN